VNQPKNLDICDTNTNCWFN